MEGFISKFKVPDVAVPVINEIVRKEEILLVEALDTESFTILELKEALNKNSERHWKDEELKVLVESAYKRAIIDLVDESFTKFKIASFYSRLDLFAMTENEKYSAFPRELRVAIDKWYFDAYVNGLGDEERPSSDRVATLQEALEYIDTIDRPIWLNRCDCRSLAGNCEKPTDTCISFRSGINTTSHRGWSKSITKEEAKAVMRRANAAGLMQTINPNCICNCCGDCCYLFRAQKRRKSEGIWPKTETIAEFDEDSCIGCGTCISRCNFQAFCEKDGQISYNAELCRGCGLCTETCPVSAIALIRRG